MIYYFTNSLFNKNSFKLHLNIDIETSQLILILRTFQIRALMLLKVFCTGEYSELMATSSIVLMDTIIASIIPTQYKCAIIDSGKRLREYLYIIKLYKKIFSLKEELPLIGKVDWYVLNNERSSLFL